MRDNYILQGVLILILTTRRVLTTLEKYHENTFEYNRHRSLDFVKVNNPSKWVDLLGLHQWCKTQQLVKLSWKLLFFLRYSIFFEKKLLWYINMKLWNMWNSSFGQMIWKISLLKNNLRVKYNFSGFEGKKVATKPFCPNFFDILNTWRKAKYGFIKKAIINITNPSVIHP